MGLPSLASEIAQSGRESKGGPLPHRPNPAFLPLDQSGAAGGAAAPAGASGPGISRAGLPQGRVGRLNLTPHLPLMGATFIPLHQFSIGQDLTF